MILNLLFDHFWFISNLINIDHHFIYSALNPSDTHFSLNVFF